MEFKERIEQTLGGRLPKDSKYLVLTKRIILTGKLYQKLHCCLVNFSLMR